MTKWIKRSFPAWPAAIGGVLGAVFGWRGIVAMLALFWVWMIGLWILWMREAAK